MLRSAAQTVRRICKYILLFILFLFAGSVLSVLSIRWIDPATSSFMMQRQLRIWWSDDSGSPIRHEWVDWSRISDHLKIAAIAAEDQHFADHWGIDFEQVQRAIDEHQQGKDLRGASTITQQTAKNMYLWSGQSFIRKGIEAYIAVLMELLLPKQRILELYLNIAEFGDKVYGAEAASKTYFNTSAAGLSKSQAALMVTALPSPKRYNLASPSAYMMRRRDWNIRNMNNLGNQQYLEKL